MLCREVGDEQVAYYSSIVQLDALCAALSASDQYSCEVALLSTLTDIRIDVVAHMSLTAELSEMFRGARKSAIMIHDGVFKCCHFSSIWFQSVGLTQLFVRCDVRCVVLLCTLSIYTLSTASNLSKLLNYSVLRSTHPPILSGMRMIVVNAFCVCQLSW